MAKLIYNKANVEIFDVEGRFKDDEEFTVQLKYDKARETFLVTIPEAKKAEPKEDKPKPEEVYTGEEYGIKSTIKVNGNVKMNLDIKQERFKKNTTAIKMELDEAFQAMVKRVC